jgi:hypothetical protein
MSQQITLLETPLAELIELRRTVERPAEGAGRSVDVRSRRGRVAVKARCAEGQFGGRGT